MANDQHFQESSDPQASSFNAMQDYEAFIASELKPAAEALEQQRLQQRSRLVRRAWLACALVGAAILLSMQLKNPVWAILVTTASAVVLGATYGKSAKLNRQFKTGIAPLIVQHVCGSDARYTPFDGIGAEAFAASGLWTHTPDRYKAADGVSGKIGKTNYRFCEIDAGFENETRVRHGNSWSIETEYHPIFTGVLFQADFNPPFDGRVVIKRRGHDENLNLPQLTPGYEAFAARFDVYGSDPDLARNLLSPALMDALMHIDDRMRNKLEFSFVNGTIYIAHSTPDDRLESSMWTSYLDQESVRSSVLYLEQWVSVADLLDLKR